MIAAGVDLRTVAGRLGHSDGGTTLAYNTAWVREADQRASLALVNRLPIPRAPVAVTTALDIRPPSPYEVIATELRTAIHTGHFPPGESTTYLPATRHHHVAPSTAHRAITQLAHKQLITVTRADASACH